MTDGPARLALVHGPAAFMERVTPVLAGAGFQVRPATHRDDVAQVVASGSASVVVVDCASHAALGLGTAASRESASLARVVVLGCPDAASASAALGAGASLVARTDASPEEIASLVCTAAAEHDHQVESERVRRELVRQGGLLFKDDLTAAYNRRYFDRFVAEQIEIARASGGRLGLVFMDIDNLKAVNVRHGHPMGSLVLREAAARLGHAVGGEDKIIRYGGDEFCIVLPGRDSRGALDTAEAVRRAFAATPFAVAATGGVVLTASFGVACFPEHAADADALIRAADAAMLKVKDQKNGIQLAGPS